MSFSLRCWMGKMSIKTSNADLMGILVNFLWCKPASDPSLGSLVSDCSWQLAFASLKIVLCVLHSGLTA